MDYEGDCRTAPATPGLLKTMLHWFRAFQNCNIDSKVTVILMKELILPIGEVASGRVCGLPAKHACFGRNIFIYLNIWYGLFLNLVLIASCGQMVIVSVRWEKPLNSFTRGSKKKKKIAKIINFLIYKTCCIWGGTTNSVTFK